MTPMADLSPEAADEGLCEAINAAMAAHGMRPGILTDVMVVCSVAVVDDDGESATTVATLLPRTVPYYRVLGLIDFARLRYQNEVLNIEDEA